MYLVFQTFPRQLHAIHAIEAHKIPHGTGHGERITKINKIINNKNNLLISTVHYNNTARM
jgi:hypothetical protein